MAHVRSDIVSGTLFVDGGGDTTYTYTYSGGAPTAGNLLVIAVATATPRTVTSMAGTATTYSINGAATDNAIAGYTIEIWKAIAAGSDTTVTITLSGSNADTSYVGFAEFSEASSDQSASTANGAAFDAATAHNSGSVTPPTANNVVVVAVERTNGTWTEDAAFTHVSAADAAFYFGYLLQTSATAQEFNGTSADAEYTAMRIGAFAGAATGRTTKNTTTMGLGMGVGMNWRGGE